MISGASGSDIHADLIDVQGRSIRKERFAGTGRHALGTALAPGYYLVRLEREGIVESRKVFVTP
jgi:hypothetical protein